MTPPGDGRNDTATVAHRPAVSIERATEILSEIYGRTGTLTELPGERDRNLRVELRGGGTGVLKVSHPSETPERLMLQHEMLRRLANSGEPYAFPRPLPSRAGDDVATVVVGRETLLVRLLSWVDGVPLAGARPRRAALLESVGTMLGSVDRALADVDAPEPDRDFRWELRRATAVIAEHEPAIQDSRRRALVRRLADGTERVLRDLGGDLRQGTVHGDANDYNVLVTRVDGDPARAEARRAAGLIDFGDASRSWIAAEPAIACAYAMLDAADPVDAAKALVRGYHRRYPLTDQEIAALPHLIVQRLLVSVSLSAAQSAADPSNAYLSISEAPAWRLLAALEGTSPDWVHFALRHTCGLEPWPGNPALVGWLRSHGSTAHALLAPGPSGAQRVTLDLSVESPDMGGDARDLDPRDVSRRLFDRIRSAGAEMGIGRYDEVRGWYDGSAYQEPGETAERRTVHLGIDLFVPAGTPVFAPFDARVHSLRDNAAELDYGPTLILEHRPSGGPRFFTLFGHLAPAVLTGLSVGSPVRAGQEIAAVGDLPGNGNWPPHLHFQVIGDMLGRSGEFPGVGAPSDRALWLSLCPDPNLVLGLEDLEPAQRSRGRDDLLARRRRTLGPTLSVSYSEPLHIVRGLGQTLVDREGQRYLDCVNNVAHVGHSHPRVVRAAVAQMGVLNTNTRYLHEGLVEYAERLVATLPEPLRVCYLVCSGSEANELALRLARAHSGVRDVVVVDGAYHGNTSSLVDLSPYKFGGPGGEGAPDWVHVVPMPDAYRGLYRGEDGSCGDRYADTVLETLEAMAASGRRPAAFLCESILSCGGQVPLPPGYLERSVAAVRAAGGLYVADEVQVGFGRVGTHFWGFEEHGVVPDVVTMGKPIGNGHPLGAVVTTPEVAASFDNGMEYFNTFGGNPVSCAVGLAVLDVIRDERLQWHAAEVGAALLSGLKGLVGRHRWIGDVRGRGLFVGVEIVTDPLKRTPGAAHCRHLVERMRERGILLSTDGPDHNVIKIKPPLVFDAADAERVVSELDDVLSEDAFRVEP